MFRRLFWLVTGAAFGFGVSFWVMRFVRTTVERYAPERVSADIGAALRRFGDDLRAALAEGREAMRAREAALRDELQAGSPHGGRAPGRGRAQPGGDRGSVG